MATILCVDDEPELLAALSEELEDAGYDVIQAEDGCAGVEKAVQHKPDLIVSDITMPGKDGFELLKEIRDHHPRLADVPVIFLSALADRNAILDGVHQGADDYLTKPVDFDMLQAKIAAKLRMSGRMISRKQLEHIKLYKTLTERDQHEPAILREVTPRRIVLVGRGDRELSDVRYKLDQLGHNTHTFTSGSTYLQWADEGRVKAEITFLWFHTDDMQAPMIRKLSPSRSGPFVMVIPEKLNDTNRRFDLAGFTTCLTLPTTIDALADLIEGLD